MNPQDAIDFSREAIKTCMLVGGPILAASLLIGLIVGIIQTMTQIQDQTVSFVPKILLLLLMIGVCLPWLTERMIDFSTESFSTPMTHWENSRSAAHYPADAAPPVFEPTPPASKSPFKTASFSLPANQTRTPASHASFVPLDPTKPIRFEKEIQNKTSPFALPDLPTEPANTNSPFILPHYRISKAPKTEIEG